MTEALFQTSVYSLPIERTLDFIQFRTTFINNYDFERIREYARDAQIKRTGSRTTCWKVRSFLSFLQNLPYLLLLK